MRGVKVTFLDLEPILARLTERAQALLAGHPTIREIELFGSLVQDSYSPGSDADILVVLEDDPRRFVDRIPEFLEHFSGLGIPVDVFPYTVAELEMMRDTGFIKTVLAECVLLATRAERSES